MIGRVALAFAALVAMAAAARAAAPETLSVVRDCPSKGWHRACLPIAFYYRDDGAKRLVIRKTRSGSSAYEQPVRDHIVIEGSLLEGRGRGVFRLRLDDPLGDNEVRPENDLGLFAFVGRSTRGRPIILTDRGPIEILTPSVDFEVLGNQFVVHERRGAVLREVMHGHGMPFVVTKTGEIGVWDASRTICIAAPDRTTRELAIITTACKAAGVPDEGEVVGGNVSPVGEMSMQSVSDIIGNEPVTFDAYRAPGTGLLLIWTNWSDCC